jgi:hypothetical protein
MTGGCKLQVKLSLMDKVSSNNDDKAQIGDKHSDGQ